MKFDGVLVRQGEPLRHALERMTATGITIALVVDAGQRLQGLVTDGDLRRALLRGVGLDAAVDEAMNRMPLVAPAGISADAALAMMRPRALRHLPVVDDAGRVIDVLRLDELLSQAPPALGARAVVMAGGAGRRLHPLTETLPKPLVRVGGKPLIEILIERLRRAGIAEVTVAVHHRSEMIREALGDGRRLGVRLEYVEETKPLGTMGALTLLRGRVDAPFFVVNGDILTKCDFRAMYDFHRRQAGAAMTVGVSLHQVEIPYGEFTLRGDRVLHVDEKPRKEYPINAGIYVVDPSVIDAMPSDEYVDATELMRLLLGKDRLVAAYVIREYWLDVGRLHDFEKANRDVAEGLLE